MDTMKNMKKKDKMYVGDAPVILKVKDLEEDSRFAGIHDHLPKLLEQIIKVNY